MSKSWPKKELLAFFQLQSFVNKAKKKIVVLFPEIGRVKISSSLTRPHSHMCIRIYIFCFKQKNHTHRNKKQKKPKKKKKKIEKKKETKEEKEKENVVVVNNICGKSNGI